MTRDVTAWACLQLLRTTASGIGPILLGKWLAAWARLGPFSTSCPFRFNPHRRFPALRSAPALAQQGGLAVSRLDGRGISLLRRHPLRRHLAAEVHRCIRTARARRRGSRPYPDPTPRICRAWPAITGRLSPELGSDAPVHEGLSPRVTCGAPLAATLTRPACWAFCAH